MSLEAASIGVTVVLAAVVGYRLQLLRRARSDPAFLWYCIGMGLGIPYLLLRLPPVHTAVSTVLGIPNIAHPLALSMVVIGGSLLRPLHLGLQTPAHSASPTGRTWLVLLLALVSMAGTFAPVRVADDSTWFVLRDAGAPFVLTYQLTYSVWISVVLLSFGLPSWRYGRSSSDSCTRIGVGVLVPLGVAFGLAALTADLWYVASVRFRLPYPPGFDPVVVFSSLSLVAFLALCVGSTMPAWGPRVGLPALDEWLQRYMLYQGMYPLWLELYRASPWIALIPPRSRARDVLTLTDLDFRFYRRVVEIWDGRLALRNFTDPEVQAVAHRVCQEAGLPAAEHEYVTAAAMLLVATKAKQHNEPTGQPCLAIVPMAPDVDGEARVLARVSRYCGDTALMTLIAKRVTRRAATVQQAVAR